MISPKVLGAFAFAAVLGLGSCAARAQVTTQGANWTAPASGQWRITFGSNGTPLLNQGGRAYVPGAAGAVGVRDTGSILRGPAISATRNVPWAAVVRGAVAAGRVATPIGAALVLASLLDDARVQADGQGGLLFDPGADPNMSNGYGCSANGQLYTSASKATAQQSCARAEAEFICTQNRETGEGYTRTCTVLTTVAVGQGHATNYRTAYCVTGGGCANQNFQTTAFIADPMPMPATCPPSWDNTVPTVDADGKCPTGRYTQPLDDAAAEQRIGSYGDPSRAAGTVKDAVDRGVGVEHDPAQVTGPASDPAGTTTTQRVVNGVPQTVTTTVTNNYNYSGDTITNNTSTRTVVTNTETGEVISDDTTTESGTPPESVEICAENPGTVMCTQLGQPSAEQPTWQTREVLWTTEALGLPAGCPAPITAHLSITNQDLSFDWTPVCSWAPMVRAGMLALVAMSCGLYLIAAVRGSRT